MTRTGRAPHYNVTFAVLAVSAITYALLQSLIVPTLHTIQQDLNTSTAAVTWVLTAFMISASVATPIFGRLGDMFGKKRFLVVSLLVVALGTLVSAMSSSLGPLVVGRVIQGFGGAVFPLSFGIIRDEFPRGRIASGIALISAILGVGGGLGIVLAGPITTHLSYHWLFWIPLGVSLVAAAAAFFVIPESPIRVPGRVDWAGAVLLSSWLVTILLAISEGAFWGWTSGRVLGLFAVGIVLLVVWVVFETRVSEPLVYMRTMRLRGVWTTNTASLLLGFGMFSSFILIPQFVQMPVSTGYGFGASVTEGSLSLLPNTIALLLVSPLAGRLSRTVGSKTPLVLGSVAATMSFVLLALAHSELWQVYVASAVMGIGIGFAFSAMANLIVEAVPPAETGVATGMNTIMRSIGGAVGAQVTASILTASLAASGYPTENGFMIAFTVSAIVLLAALGFAILVPGRRTAATAPSVATAGD